MNQPAPAHPVKLVVLMPHPPVVIPAVGGDRLVEVESTVRAMRDVAREVFTAAPDTVVLISPHTPRQPAAFPVWAQERVGGTFAQFGAPAEGLELPVDVEFLKVLAKCGPEAGAGIHAMSGEGLDHGALVPLWFLHEAGWRGPTVIIGLNWPGSGGLRELGRAIMESAKATGRNIAIVASGDMSHRLIPGAPAGYDPSAKEFDRAFVEILRRREYRDLDRIDSRLQNRAAEDVVDSTVVALSAVNWSSAGGRVLSYEGPFGVGYTVAVLYSAAADGSYSPENGDELPAIARRAVEAALHKTGVRPPAPASDYLARRAGIFVTIRTAGGALRGCVGSLDNPRCTNLVEETWEMAQLAAFRDDRFPPVAPWELHNLRFEVSVLHSFEEVSSVGELAPERFGVLVEAEGGRRATLLPAIKEITTSEHQFAVVCEKGGFRATDVSRIVRYQVDKFAGEGLRG